MYVGADFFDGPIPPFSINSILQLSRQDTAWSDLRFCNWQTLGIVSIRERGGLGQIPFRLVNFFPRIVELPANLRQKWITEHPGCRVYLIVEVAVRIGLNQLERKVGLLLKGFHLAKIAPAIISQYAFVRGRRFARRVADKIVFLHNLDRNNV